MNFQMIGEILKTFDTLNVPLDNKDYKGDI